MRNWRKLHVGWKKVVVMLLDIELSEWAVCVRVVAVLATQVLYPGGGTAQELATVSVTVGVCSVAKRQWTEWTKWAERFAYTSIDFTHCHSLLVISILHCAAGIICCSVLFVIASNFATLAIFRIADLSNVVVDYLLCHGTSLAFSFIFAVLISDNVMSCKRGSVIKCS